MLELLLVLACSKNGDGTDLGSGDVTGDRVTDLIVGVPRWSSAGEAVILSAWDL
jgi:hypothetical protein